MNQQWRCTKCKSSGVVNHLRHEDICAVVLKIALAHAYANVICGGTHGCAFVRCRNNLKGSR